MVQFYKEPLSIYSKKCYNLYVNRFSLDHEKFKNNFRWKYQQQKSRAIFINHRFSLETSLCLVSFAFNLKTNFDICFYCQPNTLSDILRFPLFPLYNMTVPSISEWLFPKPINIITKGNSFVAVINLNHSATTKIQLLFMI